MEKSTPKATHTAAAPATESAARQEGASLLPPGTAQLVGLQASASGSRQVSQLQHYQQLANQAPTLAPPIQRQPNATGLPDQLKSGIESMSGHSLDDVKVHYNSAKPAQLNAHAYAQGTNIHLASGQEQHLPHEAWHVVQQKQGRVQPTMQMNGAPINDNPGLEQEADVMGSKALQRVAIPGQLSHQPYTGVGTVQRAMFYDPVTKGYKRMKKHPDSGEYEEKEGPYSIKEDRKLTILHQIAEEARDATKKDLGPHLAIAIMGGKMYAGVNEVFNSDDTINAAQIKNAVYTGTKNWLKPYRQAGGKITDENAVWVLKAYEKGKDAIHVALAQSGNTRPSDGAWHGEIAVAKAMMADLDTYRQNKENTPKGMKKVLRIGGSKTNCLTCHSMIHGKLSRVVTPDSTKHVISADSEQAWNAPEHPTYLEQGKSLQTNLNEVGGNQFKFLTGGTHGEQFPGANHVDGLALSGPSAMISNSPIYQSEVPKNLPNKKHLDGYRHATEIGGLLKDHKQAYTDYKGADGYQDPQLQGSFYDKRSELNKKIQALQTQINHAKEQIPILFAALNEVHEQEQDPRSLHAQLTYVLTQLIVKTRALIVDKEAAIQAAKQTISAKKQLRYHLVSQKQLVTNELKGDPENEGLKQKSNKIVDHILKAQKDIDEAIQQIEHSEWEKNKLAKTLQTYESELVKA